MDSFTGVGALPTWEQVLASLIKPPIGNLRDGHKPSQPEAAKPDLCDYTTFLSPSRDTKNMTLSGNAGWIWWAHQGPNLSHMHYSALKDCSPCLSSTGSDRCRVASYLACSKQLKHANSGCSR